MVRPYDTNISGVVRRGSNEWSNVDFLIRFSTVAAWIWPHRDDNQNIGQELRWLMVGNRLNEADMAAMLLDNDLGRARRRLIMWGNRSAVAHPITVWQLLTDAGLTISEPAPPTWMPRFSPGSHNPSDVILPGPPSGGYIEDDVPKRWDVLPG